MDSGAYKTLISQGHDMVCCLQALSASRQASYHTLEVNLEDLKKERAGLQAEVKLLRLQLSQVELLVKAAKHHGLISKLRCPHRG